ncbi:MAG: hypothetical protein Q9186_006507 [Xanthomendoza sp. 1 TL-2023]
MEVFDQHPILCEVRGRLPARVEVHGRDEAGGLGETTGVSNYQRSDIEATLNGAAVLPVINQIEYHPYLQRANQYIPRIPQKGIQMASFKGLTPAFRCPEGPLQEPLDSIAKAHNTTQAVILLAWLIQNDVAAVTTTTKPERPDKYAQVLNTNLIQEELYDISEVGSTYHFRTSWPDK